ncbi:alpha-1,3-glucan synthase [Aspergillus vadensis CBS 113365]|uniref:alpha-1,3-glucan synthase n=1 Tax=Aspergillus vadensis (strain CBS 113365 / IMI 142717 / IBT 24658) TaxID=1448311 RepID=A0A319AUW3_ASPVC|nr:alpha-1,3-glucan synthase [Aspergillus vadensis CBS 113365]PYH63384.1 alpha-1,3-glucan synthase [Aspergillus vadensis CBS 113365]
MKLFIFIYRYLSTIALLSRIAQSLPHLPEEVNWNLNQNETATDPLDYSGQWDGHSYTPSPDNWRFPFYTIFLDRFVNGDPSNDDANGTQWEHILTSNQFRHGGDVLGLVDTFDYLQGMGIKGIYLAGTPYINFPWGADGYSPLDLTLMDHHYGTIDDWRTMISEAHQRGLYVLFDNTFGTMGDLIGFQGYLNRSAPINPSEYDYVWKYDRQYWDFKPGNQIESQCPWEYPRFWDDDGTGLTTTTLGASCRDSEFDQYGEVAAFGNYTEWEGQIAKFAFVQDRLRSWRPDVLAKIKHFSCLTITMLDIDGFRVDKALQVTLDQLGEWSESVRDCAQQVGKDNFYIPGEIVSGNAFGSLYIGRGRQTNQTISNITEAFMMTNKTDKATEDLFLRPTSQSALDGAAFHYTLYRGLSRFLGLDGIYAAEGDPPVNFIETWNGLVETNDMININTGKFDPRHLFGVTNQDVFRWPAIANGTHKQNLGLYIASLLMPGIPILSWGEEQDFYILDNQADNYIFGRGPMSSAQAWQLHGCYKLGASKYVNFPLDRALTGCGDDSVSLDHRDPSHPVRGLIKMMFEMRQNYPVLNDGWYLQQLSNHTFDIYLPGSNGTPTETGMWSVMRSRFTDLQNFDGQGQGNQSVWLVYSNDNKTVDHQFNCSGKDALISPFPAGTTVKNLFYPFDEYTLINSSVTLGFEGSELPNGCYPQLTMPAWGFKAFVPKAKFVKPSPYITSFSPGHDARFISQGNDGETIQIGFEFSQEMNCSQITDSLTVTSKALNDESARIDTNSVTCSSFAETQVATFPGALTSVFGYQVNLTNVYPGVHRITVSNVTTAEGNQSTNSVDHFMFRIGETNNPMVWPQLANYSRTLLFDTPSPAAEPLSVRPQAPGADMWRYSLDFGANFSPWMTYTGFNTSIPGKNWTGTAKQAWDGEHIIAQYWSKLTGSSDHWQHGDSQWQYKPPRRFPNLFIEGEFNQFGYDAGYSNTMSLSNVTGDWEIHFMGEWPVQVAFNAWGINEDGLPDQTQVYGDIDGDNVLDQVPPVTLLSNVFNVTIPPPSPYLAFKLSVNDGDLRVYATPTGSRWVQLALFILLAVIPVATAVGAVFIYLKAFYQVKFNQIGVTEKTSTLAPILGALMKITRSSNEKEASPEDNQRSVSPSGLPTGGAIGAIVSTPRRTVLIATMEYDIEDWAIKIKIGGLGVMAQLMGKNLTHQDLIWVVPCVGGVDYPRDDPREPMVVTVLGTTYHVDVQYHRLHNITYVLLDAPVFRAQSKSDPYPARMDDLNSAIFYSAWNQCIAEAIKRFPQIDLYHINDYHGAAAPLYLLPRTIPCCLSLHNAEFQGLWPMRNPQQIQEVCRVFNLDQAIVKKYVQFGDVFNLLHCAANYLKIHQNGFGAVGVSKKYGKRSYARYPIFWGLKSVGALPNPDPSDLADWDSNASKQPEEVTIDVEFEANRGALKRQAQEWAGLKVDPDAQLFVFVGRWSMQKGVDLIADIFPSVLDAHPKVQLMSIGPVIDLYGRFAALKLNRLMELYPGRVYSKPEFTALPPFIFSGAEFALIPSRDEPFGLVAVEFGRKGALGVGSRVGGLGQMPGWWYTIESMTTKHLIHQFKLAINDALRSSQETRAMMRARSGKQRFPVAQWVEDLGILQTTSIVKHAKHSKSQDRNSWRLSGVGTMVPDRPRNFRFSSSSNTSREQSRSRSSDNSGPPSRPITADAKQAVARPGHSHVASLPANLPSNPNMFNDSDTDNEPRRRPVSSTPRGGPRIVYTLGNDDQDLENMTGVTQDDFGPHLASYLSPSGAPNTPPTFANSGASTPTLGAGPDDGLLGRRNLSPSMMSLVSIHDIVKEKQDYNLQKVNPFFTDANHEYAAKFERKLAGLNGKNSEDQLCIEEFIEKSEKDWFNRYRDVKLGKSPLPSPSPSIFRFKVQDASRPPTPAVNGPAEDPNGGQFLLPKDYVPPTGLKRFMLIKLGDWPLYSIVLAIGQILALNSYQITLLNGEIGETAEKLYILASIYLASSIIWWMVFRLVPSVYVLTIPYLLYGLAFLFVGIAGPIGNSTSQTWLQNVGTGLYSFASSSGSIFFALNFGDEGGAPLSSWIYRATVIQGSQQLCISFLWYWGSWMASLNQEGSTRFSLSITDPNVLLGVGIGLACVLWLLGALVFFGLPAYYRQTPGRVPTFYLSLFRRRVILWFFYMVFISNYWLSAPYGRNWLYLWSSKHAKVWQIILLVLLFFVVVWAAALWVFHVLSKRHAWFIPIFAIGLGAPRWAQILWATSNIGTYIPWAGGPVAGAILGRALWLWLGVLDSLQGIGFGMILLNTMTRFHVTFTLLAAQVVGSVATILARATAPDKLGPGNVFPDFSAGVAAGLSKADFWVCLLLMLSINVICIFFYRKEQLSKP